MHTRPQHPPRTSLATVARWLDDAGHAAALEGPTDGVAVTGVTLSSQRVEAGDLYAAVPGSRAHGVDYAPAAVGAGAVALLTDRDGAGRAPDDVPRVVVDAPRRVLGLVAAGVYGHPAEAMRTIGVTGTQGKTTTTRLAETGLSSAGVVAAAVGTVGTRIAGEDVRTTLTTPEAPDLHGLFAVMREHDVQACAMEVSSHALEMGRVDGVVFDVAVFLNLGHDHLDFHGDMESYYRAKAALFGPDRARRALVDLDDEWGRRLLTETPLPVSTFAVGDRAAEADWSARDVEAGPTGSTFTLHGPGGLEVRASVPLPGVFNVSNAVAALAAVGEAGFDVAQVARGVAAGAVPGRVEVVDEGQDFHVVVDYAHKPDAVRAALAALRPLTTGRVLVVLGAGGDRDRGKRPVMGELAARLADVVVVTDDNPRSEDPAAIRAAVLEGARRGTAELHDVGDRREAIATAVGLAAPGDVVLVAGKGHETGQEVAGVVHPFDDRVVAREVLRRRAGGRVGR